jgi:transposase
VVAAAPSRLSPQSSTCPHNASDLNPVEGLWANLKGVELANRACGSLEELAAAEQGIGRVRGEPELLFSFLHQVGLPL